VKDSDRIAVALPTAAPGRPGTPGPEQRSNGSARGVERIGRVVLLGAVLAFAAIALPVVWRGAPLADDFHNCVAPSELGLGGFFLASWRFLGTIRPARFAEILLAAGVCDRLPFGVAIAVPLLLTIAIALLARGVLLDIGTPSPWADFGGAMWLLQPLGTEAGLWPAALHVPLGLALVLAALRLYRRGRYVWAALASVGGALSVEQVILALPVATWLVVPPPRRRTAVTITAVVALSTLIVFAGWPGSDPRLRSGIVERLASFINDPLFVVAYPAVGLGLHSIPLAIQWAFPWSIVVLAIGAAAGALVTTSLPPVGLPSRRDAPGKILGLAMLIAVVNLPVLMNVPHYGSPRLFTPTWLVLAVGVPALAARVRWRRPVLLGSVVGVFAAGAVLSLAFSVSVRLVTADFNERVSHRIAAIVPDGADVAICGVRRTVVTPAPRGAFSLHEFIYEWAARDVLAYYTGRRARFQLAGELWGRPCPHVPDVDMVISFDELLAGAHR
jgi:hypothetical protein